MTQQQEYHQQPQQVNNDIGQLHVGVVLSITKDARKRRDISNSKDVDNSKDIARARTRKITKASATTNYSHLLYYFVNDNYLELEKEDFLIHLHRHIPHSKI